MLIIPSIDILDGKCVRLRKGDFSMSTIYSEDPLEVARQFAKDGSKLIHIVDLDGARSGKPVNQALIIEIIKQSGCKIQVGGGLRTEQAARTYLKAGAYRIVIGSRAAASLNFIQSLMRKFGSEKICVALDVNNEILKVGGWLKSSEIKPKPFIKKLVNIGIENIIYTDIAKDGCLTSPNFTDIKSLIRLNKKITISGGVSTFDDLLKLRAMDVKQVIVGKAIYEGRIYLEKSLQTINNDLAKRIIPCLDVKNGRVVKGKKFMNLKDSGDPVKLARYYESQGADELVLLDISATNEGRITFTETVKNVSDAISIPLTVGGGIKTIKDIKILLRAGADKVSINSAAVTNPSLIKRAAKMFGSQCIICAIDARKVKKSYKVSTNSGQRDTNLDVINWAKQAQDLGAGEILLTSIDRDGTRIGYDLTLSRNVANVLRIPLILSGGAGAVTDFKKGLAIADAVLAAGVFHEGRIKIPALKKLTIQS